MLSSHPQWMNQGDYTTAGRMVARAQLWRRQGYGWGREFWGRGVPGFWV